MREQVTLTLKEQKRLKLLNQVESGSLTVLRAAEALQLSERQLYRLLARYRLEGAAALAHGNRGRPSPRRRRAPRPRSRRERRPRPGMLLQLDGSDHDWLEGRGPGLILIAAIDDATGEIPFALFRPQEDAAGYFLLLRQVVQRHGLPLALYADRHTIFQSPKQATLEQELAGERPSSQFGRLADELGIQLIPASSPQAKGRVERLFGTLQDRLLKALRRAGAGASSLEEANRGLRQFLPGYNRRFRKH